MSTSSSGGARPLYRHEQLLSLIRPKSIAVVGASATKDGFGTRALRTLAGVRFDGVLHAVSPRMERGELLHGVPTVQSLRDIEGGVDCVLIAVPASAVEQVIEDAVTSGCRGAIIFSAGFGEVSDEGLAAQTRMMTLAQANDLRLGGPNTAGILNYRDGLPLTFVSDLAMHLPVGNLAIVSQSAGIATHLGHVRHRGVGVSYTIATGNSVDVTALDYVNFLLDDDGTDAIALVVEGLPNAAAFFEIGRRSVECGKPIVMIKCGRTQAGSKAAISHTGSLAGNYDVFLAAARQAGIAVVETTEELIETATLFAKWADKPYRGGGAAIVTTMGGPGVMAADAAAENAVDLPEPGETTRVRLGELMPSFAAIGNPIDTTASPSDPVLTEVIAAVGEDAQYATVVMLAASMTGPSTAGRPAAIAAAADRMESPLAVVWLSSWREMPSSEVLDQHPRVPMFRSSDRCMRAIGRWISWHRLLDQRRCELNKSTTMALAAPQQQELHDLLATLPQGHATLDEAQSRRVLEVCGIDVPRAAVVTSASAAAEAVHTIGVPVVAKVVSGEVPHKASAGGVVLEIWSAEAAADAYRRIVSSVGTSCPDAVIDGVLVAESLDTKLEFMCGLTRDSTFGAVVVCGAGGRAVELIGDVAHVVVPFGRERAADAVGRLRIIERLRCTDPAGAARTESALLDVMMRVGALAGHSRAIAEVDINPVVLRGDGTPVALDALVVLSPDGAA